MVFAPIPYHCRLKERIFVARVHDIIYKLLPNFEPVALDLSIFVPVVRHFSFWLAIFAPVAYNFCSYLEIFCVNSPSFSL